MNNEQQVFEPFNLAYGKAIMTSRRLSQGNTALTKNQTKIDPNKIKMIDQMFIFGPPPNKSQIEGPQVLTMFPSTGYQQTDDDIKKLIKLCFPNKFDKVSEDISPSTIILNQFTFFLDNENSSSDVIYDISPNRTYGIVVQFRAPPDFTPYFASNSTRQYPFALLILTHTYYLSSHYEFALYLALYLAGKASCTDIKNRSPFPVSGFCHPTLTLDKKSPAIAVYPGIAAPLHLIDILVKYSTTSIEPQENPLIDLPYCNDIPNAVPLNLSYMRCLSYPTMDSLFSSFPLNDISKMYNAVLLEKKICFVSPDPHMCSSCVIAMMTLMKPFRTACKFVPILNIDTSLVFEEPIVCGISGVGDIQPLFSLFDVVALVNTFSFDSLIKTSSISTAQYQLKDSSSSLSSSTLSTSNASLEQISLTSHSSLRFVNGENHLYMSDDYPLFPKYEELNRKLGFLIDNRISDATVPPPTVHSFFGRSGQNPEFKKFLQSIEPYNIPPYYLSQHPQKFIFPSVLVDSIREVFASLISFDLNEKIIASLNEGELDKEVFLSKFRNEEKPFIAMFVETMAFDDFLKRTQKQLQRKAAKSNKIPFPTINTTPRKRADAPKIRSSPTVALTPFTNEE